MDIGTGCMKSGTKFAKLFCTYYLAHFLILVRRVSYTLLVRLYNKVSKICLGIKSKNGAGSAWPMTAVKKPWEEVRLVA